MILSTQNTIDWEIVNPRRFALENSADISSSEAVCRDNVRC
jgi:hypothetical protein